MNTTALSRTVLVSSAAVLLALTVTTPRRVAAKGGASNKTDTNKAALKKFVQASDKLRPEVKKHLSRSMQNYLRFAGAVVNGAKPFEKDPADNLAARGKKHSWPFDLVPVSNPALDPAVAGYTQNTSSTAWCGGGVVVGYDDFGAFLRTNPNGAFDVPTSFEGVSYSANGGKTFTDVGFLNPGTFSANSVFGDPAVTCSSATHFQYASILNTTTPDGVDPLIGPSISFSADGGKMWSDPLQVVSLDGNTQTADSTWLAVDPANTQRLYLSYTQIDFLDCVSINVVRSVNGGQTWSAPVTVDQECPPTEPPFIPQNMVNGSRVVVAPDGRVDVVYEFFPGFDPDVTSQPNAIKFASSADHGATFTRPVKIADLVPNGTSIELNGHTLFDEFPQIAVDRSAGPNRGTLYVTYPDGRDRVVPDANSPTGTYAYPDIFVAKSTDGGRSFSVRGAISPTPADFPSGSGRDQLLPGIAVDKDGQVAVCYYDRRNDPSDLRIDRFCSVSSNQGNTWSTQQISKLDWLPMFNTDSGYDIGAYDALTSDFLRHEDGFFGGFVVEINGNQNVVAAKVEGKGPTH